MSSHSSRKRLEQRNEIIEEKIKKLSLLQEEVEAKKRKT